MLILFPAQAVLTITMRAAIRLTFVQARARGYNVRYLLIVGANDRANAFADAVTRHRELGLQPMGHLATSHDRMTGTDRLVPRPIVGDLADIEEILHGSVVDEVAICLSTDDREAVEPIARLCEEEGRVVRIPMAQPGLIVPGGTLEDFDGIQVLSLVYGPDRTIGMLVKRLLDVGIAVVGMILLSPLLAASAITVLLLEGRPILFRQVRVGLHGRPFSIVKFRTMAIDAEERYVEVEALSDTKGPAFKMKDDPRVTRIGRLLRRSSIDEIPQLWNVLRGEMSIVGPRPAPPREVVDYDVWHRRRLSMKPGITGLWQIEARFDENFDNRARLDLNYIDRWTLFLDLQIILRTIPALVANPGR
jgi:exopolysaccharide biosynthesis polyprenyl glycosylphosphotransferase